MKNYNHLFLATVIVLGITVFLIPCSAKAASPASGLFTFISPSGGEKIVVGKTYDIEWKGPIKWIVSPKIIESISHVKLTISCGDPSLAATNDTVIVKSTANDGLYKWSVPKKIGLSDYCRIIIEDTKGKYRDVSPVFGIGMTPAPTLNVSCSASPSSVSINQTVTFISSVSGGTGSYSYSWSGACTGTDTNCSNSFSNSGTYNASLTVISGSQSKSASCSVSVIAPIPIGSLTLSKYTAYTDQTVVAPLTDFKLAHFALTADPAEAVNVNTIQVDLTNLAAYTTNLYVKFGNSTTAVKPTVGATNTWSVNYPLAAGQTVDVMVYGDINSSVSGTGQVSVLISGTGVSSAASVDTNSGFPLVGQTINFVTGSISSAVDGSTPLAQAVSGNQQVTAAKFKITASYDNYTIQELRVTVNGDTATAAVINSAILRDGSTVLAVVSYDTTHNYFYFTGLSVSIPANTSKVLTVDLSLATPSADLSTTGKNAKLTLTYFKVLNSQGTAITDTNTRTGNDLYIYKSIPIFTLGTVTGQGVNLSAGATISLYKFNVAADSKGDIALKQLKLNVIISKNSSSGTPVLSNFKLFRGSTDITSFLVTIQNNSGNSLEGTTSIGTGTNVIVVTFDTEEVIPAGISYTYTLKAVGSGFAVSSDGNDSVSTNLLADNMASADSALYYLSAVSDTGVQTLYTAKNHGGGDTTENVIWSDNSAISHDYAYNASSADWFNGYLIPNLPLDAIGIVSQ